LQRFKTAFFDLFRGDKTKLIVLITQIIVAFLFAVALLLPYMVSSNLIDGSLSSSDFPGGGFYTFIFFVSILGFAYLAITNDEQHKNWVFLGQAILATFIYFYSLLFHKVGLASASNGIGKVLEFILLIVFWFLIFGKKQVIQLIHKFVPEKVIINELVEPEPVIIKADKPNKSYIPKSVDVKETTTEGPLEETPKKVEEPTHE
jgi:hypothetical protein